MFSSPFLIVQRKQRPSNGKDKKRSSKGAGPNTLNNQRFAAAYEIPNAHRRNRQIKFKFILPQSKKVQIKRRGNVVRKLTLRRHAVHPARRWNREY